MIYTASFALSASPKMSNKCLLAISNGLPAWYKGGRYKKLAPSYELIKLYKSFVSSADLTDKQMYAASYFKDVLDKLDPKKVLKELEQLGHGKDIVLLTQESADEFSHRILVRIWFNEAGIPCTEII